MIMLVWWILSLFGVCEFTWLPVMIDCGLSTLCMVFSTDDSYAANVTALLPAGVGIFALCKHFLALDASGWWLLLSPVWLVVAFFVPGGYTITNLVLSHHGIMALPTWVLIVGIVADVITLIAEICIFVDNARS